MKIITLYVTHKNKEQANKIVDYLLEERLIACANYIPITSRYWWKGEIEHVEEDVTLLKTRPENFEAVREEIIKMHPYEVPCILKLEAESNDAYRQWIFDETNSFSHEE